MKTIRYIIAAAALLTMILTAPPIHPLNAAEEATITFINQSDHWLTFYIDRRQSVTVPPKDQGSDLTNVGRHSLRCEVTVSGKKVSISRTMDLSAKGGTWTITE